MGGLLIRAGDWLVTRLVWIAVGFLLCIPLLGDSVTSAPPERVTSVIAPHMPASQRPAVEAPVHVVVTSSGTVSVTARKAGFCLSPGFGFGFPGYVTGVLDLKLAYAGGLGVGVGVSVGRGVMPYWALMWDPRKRGWSIFLGGGIYEKRAICGLRVRY